MKTIIPVFIISFLLCSQAQVQGQPKKERIKYLFALMHQDSLINKTFDAMAASTAARMTSLLKDTNYAKTRIDPDKIKKVIAKTMEQSKENARKLVNEDMVDIYDKYFSLEEVEDFIIFYKSKSGQKMIDKLPDITKDIMTAMSVKYQPGMQQSLMKEIQEIMKEQPRQQ
jgi:hypothetical protein